jgi:hypothetical protein
MIQLLGNSLGQEASTLYAGGACACVAEQNTSASKQAPIENENAFLHPFVQGIPSPPMHAAGIPS